MIEINDQWSGLHQLEFNHPKIGCYWVLGLRLMTQKLRVTDGSNGHNVCFAETFSHRFTYLWFYSLSIRVISLLGQNSYYWNPLQIYAFLIERLEYVLRYWTLICIIITPNYMELIKSIINIYTSIVL